MDLRVPEGKEGMAIARGNEQTDTRTIEGGR
jgi:hypothetical protein